MPPPQVRSAERRGRLGCRRRRWRGGDSGHHPQPQAGSTNRTLSLWLRAASIPFLLRAPGGQSGSGDTQQHKDEEGAAGTSSSCAATTALGGLRCQPGYSPKQHMLTLWLILLAARDCWGRFPSGLPHAQSWADTILPHAKAANTARVTGSC